MELIEFDAAAMDVLRRELEPMKIEIKNRFTGKILFTHDAEGNTIKLTLEAAVSARANLAGANLVGANIAGANLVGANLDGAYLAGEVLTKTPLSLLNLKWPVLVTSQCMRIGCRRHTHAEWAAFDDDTISDMSPGALDFWNQWKGVLLEMCKQHRGES